MAGSINKVILIGNLGKDPEIRTMQNGGRVANLALATSESWKDKTSGERKERTEWHRVVIFNDNLITLAERYLKKGSKVFLEGQLETRKYQDKDGAERYTTEVVLRQYRGEIAMLDGRNSGDNDNAESSYSSGGGSSMGGGKVASGGGGALDDEIPF